MIEAGSTYSHSFSFTQAEVDLFAKISGDNNPLHINAEFAANTPFKRPIMHGFLGGSIFSKVFGTLFPGEGTIFMKQNMQFMRPMFVDTVYEAQFTVKEVFKEKHRAIIETTIVDKATGLATIIGDALVMNTTKI